MKSRAEVIDECVEVAGEDEDVLWTLATNTTPMRRAYFEAIIERTPRQIVKCLARLANVGVLTATDGLLFSIENEKVRDGIAERIPESTGMDLATKSLTYGESDADLPQAFFVDHALRAGDPMQAAVRILDGLPSETEESNVNSGNEVRSLMRVIAALQDADQESSAEFCSVGHAVVRRGGAHLKPRMWRDLIASLLNHPHSDDAFCSELQAADVEFKKRRASVKKAEVAAMD